MDWNNDGKHDLIVGDTNGNVLLYLNISSGNISVLSEGEYILSDNEKLNAGERATPEAGDWNGDGRKDLVIGNIEGNIEIYLNFGTDSQPVFGQSYPLILGSEVFNIDTRSAPRICDWNKDGSKDLMIGGMAGYIYYLKNEGTNNTPLFNRVEKLFLKNGDVLRYPSPGGAPRSRLYVTDWNNDGFDDILLGGMDGRVMLYLSDNTPLYSPVVIANRIRTQLTDRIIVVKRELRKRLRQGLTVVAPTNTSALQQELILIRPGLSDISHIYRRLTFDRAFSFTYTASDA